MSLTKLTKMIFKYTHTQKNGKISYGFINLDDVVNARLIKADRQTEEGLVEEEAFFLDTKFIIQSPVEVPVERAATKEEKMAGRKAFSHSKWELGSSLYSVMVTVTDEVEFLKEHYNKTAVNEQNEQ